MAARAIVPPYTVFTAADGTPLEAGFVYIGTAGLNPEVNPINVYLDAALTIPVAQPIRTLAGYPSSNGTPAQLYVNFVNYSITIRDKNGVLVVTAQNAAQILTAGNITNVPSGSIVATNVQAAIDELGARTSATRTIQKFLAGSGTYTTPANCVAIRVRVVGGGGGGAPAGTVITAGTAGGATTFGAVATANGGSGATNTASNTPGTGVLGVGLGFAVDGGRGTCGTYLPANYGSGGNGGSSYLGGEGGGGTPNGGFGTAAAPNSGSGGGGGGSSAGVSSGAGGSSGGYVESLVTSPAASYSYAVGAAGVGGTGSVANGGTGSAGLIIVEEYYA